MSTHNTRFSFLFFFSYTCFRTLVSSYNNKKFFHPHFHTVFQWKKKKKNSDRLNWKRMLLRGWVRVYSSSTTNAAIDRGARARKTRSFARVAFSRFLFIEYHVSVLYEREKERKTGHRKMMTTTLKEREIEVEAFGKSIELQCMYSLQFLFLFTCVCV